MTSICVIGNSHVASLKTAWDRIKERHINISITFFAQRSVGIKDLTIENGLLVAGNEDLKKAMLFTSNGLDKIDPNSYDFVLLYGLGLIAPIIEPTRFFSKAVIETVLLGNVEKSLSFKTLKKLRKISEKKIFLGHVPLRKSLDNMPSSSLSYEHGVDIANSIAFSNQNAEMVKQPKQTIVNGNRTHSKYSTGSKVLDIGDKHDGKAHSLIDDGHMNADFGEIWLENFLTLNNF